MVTFKEAARIVQLGEMRAELRGKLTKMEGAKGRGTATGSVVASILLNGYVEKIGVAIDGVQAVGLVIAGLARQIAAIDRELRALGAVVPS